MATQNAPMLLTDKQINQDFFLLFFFLPWPSPGFKILLNSPWLLSILVCTGDKAICHLWSGRYILNIQMGNMSMIFRRASKSRNMYLPIISTEMTIRLWVRMRSPRERVHLQGLRTLHSLRKREHAFCFFLLSLDWVQGLALGVIHLFLQCLKVFLNMDWNHHNWSTEGNDSQSMFSVGAGPITTGNLIEMQNVRLHPKPTKSKTLGM